MNLRYLQGKIIWNGYLIQVSGVGLLTLIVLEIVLGIDKLVFIAIPADKLPPKQRDRARLIACASHATGAAFNRLLAGNADRAIVLGRPILLSGRAFILLLGGYFCW